MAFRRALRAWFEGLGEDPWATCPFTQSGFIRVSSNPRIVDGAVSPLDALQVLVRLTEFGRHSFWPDDLDMTSAPEIPGGPPAGDRCLLAGACDPQ